MAFMACGKSTCFSGLLLVLSFVISAFAAELHGTVLERQVLSNGKVILCVTPRAGSDVVALKIALEKLEGNVLALSPEGTLFVAMDTSRLASLQTLGEIAKVREYTRARQDPTRLSEKEYRGGALPPKEGEIAPPPARIVPNELSKARAALEGGLDRPTQVDNSISDCFPPIGNQAGNDCVSWACAYYYNTQLQAVDEGYVVSDNNTAHICNPLFLYSLVNDGVDSQSYIEETIIKMGEVGCSSLQTQFYSNLYFYTWPTESTWIEAMPRRTRNRYILSLETEQGLEEAKQHLANGKLLVTRADVYSSWRSTYPTGTGINNNVLYAHSGTLVYGHAMTIVGYDDNKEYNDGTQVCHGAFLVCNSWGAWGIQNSSGTGDRGFMWVAYQYANTNNGCFDEVYYTDDRPRYRPKLYAAVGVNQTQRDKVRLLGGVGDPTTPIWQSHRLINYDGGAYYRLEDTKRLVIDLTDGMYAPWNFNQIDLFVTCTTKNTANSNTTITSADFYHDFDGDGNFTRQASSSPVVTITPNQSGSATASFRGDDFLLTPPEPFVSQGYQEGPFSPASKTYTLTNNGSVQHHWSCRTDQSWIEFTPSSGVLGPGESAVIEGTLHPEPLPAGDYSGFLEWKNEETGVCQQRAILLSVKGLAALPFLETFEGGPILPLYWVIEGTYQYRTQVTTENEPYAGLYHLTMDDYSRGGSFSRNELTLTINLEGASNVQLRFWAKSFGDEPHGPPSIPFSDHADFDGVAVSTNGTLWYEIQGLRSIPTTYSEYVVDLDQAIANHGLSYTRYFKIRFNQYDDDSIYRTVYDGLAFDNISIDSTTAPTGTPSPTPTPSPSPSPTASPTASSTPSPTASLTASPTASPTPTASQTTPPTSTPSPTPSPSPSPAPIVPEKPINLSPTHYASNVPVAATLQSSPFVSNRPGAFHSASWWEVRIFSSPDDYSDVLYSSGESVPTTSITLPEGYLQNLYYYAWRVKYRDQTGLYSEWSDETVFQVEYGAVPQQPPDTPFAMNPPNEQIGVDVCPRLVASPFSDINAEDTFAGVQWQIRLHPGSYDTPVYDSGELPAGYRSHRVPTGVLIPGTVYFWHVRYKDSSGLWSAWSEEICFITAFIADIPVPQGLRAASGARSVWLTWFLPRDPSITHFNIYRSNPAATQFNRINRAPVRGLEYLDQDLEPGITYYYSVTAAMDDGIESERSGLVPATTGKARLFMSSLRGEPGNVIVQHISMDNPNQLTDQDMEIRVRYNPAVLTPQGIRKSPLSNSLSFADNATSANGLLRIRGTGYTQIIGEGHLFDILYKVNASAEATTRSMLKFPYATFRDMTGREVELDYSSTATMVVAPEFQMGDINNDDAITTQDLVGLARFVLGELIPNQRHLFVGDINADDLLDSADFVLLRRYLMRQGLTSFDSLDLSPLKMPAKIPDSYLVAWGTPTWESDHVTVSLWLNTTFGIGGMDLVLQFNPAHLAVKSLQQGQVLEKQFGRVFFEEGQIRIVLAGEAPTVPSFIKLADVRFTLKGEWDRSVLKILHCKLCNEMGINLARMSNVATRNTVLIRRASDGYFVY